ncbi:MAG: hypothetical protein R3E63_09220 [Pseudomonadales bacterium]
MSDTANTHSSLWRDVQRDVMHNPAAMIGFSFLLLIFLFCTLGKLVWRVDANAIDLTQISQAPNRGVLTTVIDTQNALHPPSNSPVTQFQSLSGASTEKVSLAWPVHDIKNYRLYRHILPPSGMKDLGLPLADITATAADTVLHYDDTLLLENRRYYYSLQTLSDKSHYQTIAVDVAHATPLAQLQQSGLLSKNEPTPERLLLPAHPFGTDKLGRDMLARLIEGGRISLFIGFTAPLLYVFFGTLYGAIAGYRGGRTDTLMMSFADFIIALPFLLFVILLRIAFGIGLVIAASPHC